MKILETQPEDRKKAAGVSIIVDIILIILLLLPFMSFQVPPPGEEGILVSFGMPDMGRGDDMPDTQQEEEVIPQPVETTPPLEEPQKAEEQVLKEEIVTQEDPNAIALKKKEEEEARKKAEKERLEQLEEQRRQEEEARKKAEYNETKKQFGDLFGKGKGETETTGNQGDPLGDPNADNLKGLSTGKGSVGGGLGGRQIRYKPKVVEKSQKTGLVVIRVCVDDSGKVIEAGFTQRGSTTGDPDLVATAIRFSKQYRFSESTVSKQCGTITYDFKVQ